MSSAPKYRSLSVLKRLIAQERRPKQLAALLIEHGLARSEKQTLEQILAEDGRVGSGTAYDAYWIAREAGRTAPNIPDNAITDDSSPSVTQLA